MEARGKNIALIGMPGSSKTTVGKRLSAMLKMDFIDTDELYVKRYGEEIAVTFEKDGEKTFREREKQIVKEVCGFFNAVIATGGGAVLDKESAELIKSTAFTVELYASAETIFNRTNKNSIRPLLKNTGVDGIKKLYNERGPVYSAYSHMRICTDDLSPLKTAARIAEEYQKENIGK